MEIACLESWNRQLSPLALALSKYDEMNLTAEKTANVLYQALQSAMKELQLQNADRVQISVLV